MGLWAALDALFPTTAHQRCWNHRALNVQAKLPKSLHSEVRRRLKEMYTAPTRAECERLRDEYVVDLSSEGRVDAAETVIRDWESFVSFYDLYVVFDLQMCQFVGWVRGARRIRLGERWRPLNGGRNLMGLLADEARFEDGILTELPLSAEEEIAA